MVSIVNVLEGLSRSLDEQEPHLRTWDAYYAGVQPLAFLSPEAREALGNRLSALVTNYPRLVVESIAERLRVTGFTVDGEPLTDVWEAWELSEFDELHTVAHVEALTLGRSFVSVWATTDGAPALSVESAHEVAVLRDPITREVTAAAKRWREDGRAHAVLFLPDRVYSYVSSARVPEGGQIPPEGWQHVRNVVNPLGVVPVVPLVNRGRLLDVDGVSEMSQVVDLTDATSKLMSDLMVSSEHFARPRRWVTGLEIREEPRRDDQGNVVYDETGDPVMDPVQPFPTNDGQLKLWQAEEAEAKFGQFDGADLTAYSDAIKVLRESISAVSGLPGHMLGVMNDNPTSADAIRSAEASLVARAYARQRSFSPSWAKVAKLTAAVANGSRPVRVQTVWANPETRTVAQEADATAKLVQAGILPVEEALARLGYTPEQIENLRSMTVRAALDRQAIAPPALGVA